MSQSANPAASAPVSPFLVLFFGIFAISVSAILIRFAQGEAVPSLTIAAWRLTLATLLLLPLCIANHRPDLRQLSRRQLWPIVLSGVALAIHFATWIKSLEYTSVAASGVLVSTSPLWVALLSPLLLNERVNRPTQIGILLAFVGSAIIALGEGGKGSQPLLGDLLALTGALTASAYLIVGRKLRVTLPLIPYITLVYGSAAITLLLAVAVAGQPLLGYPPTIYLLLLLMAIFPQLLGHSSFNYALGYLPAAYVTVAVISEPIGSSLLALLIFRELPGLLTIIGGILILIGIFLASRQQL